MSETDRWHDLVYKVAKRVEREAVIAIVERHLGIAHAARQALESRGLPSTHTIGACLALDTLLAELRGEQ